MRALAASAVLGLVLGCTPPPPPPPPPPPTCASSCLGCCNAAGLCESGADDVACGAAGASCVACPDGVSCHRGICIIPSDGGTFRCADSACDSTADRCIDGLCHCGTAATCTSSDCVNGECGCEPARCNGCCDGTQCVSFFAHESEPCDGGCFACTDTYGNICAEGLCRCGNFAACGPGTHCANSICVCDPSTCAGCCDGSNCVLPADQNLGACGPVGGSCVSCSFDADNCDAGACGCGNGPACPNGTTCENGACVCSAPGCQGCCEGNTCVAFADQNVSACGAINSQCLHCPTGITCTTFFGCACQGRIVCGTNALTVGAQHSCGWTERGTVRCWGSNANGQLGLDGGTDRLVPETMRDTADVFAHLAAGDTFTCGVSSQSGLACWGDTPIGSSIDPMYISSPQFPADITGGAAHLCTLDFNGRSACLGDNTYGQVTADGGALVMELTPVVGLPPVAAIAAGRTHTCAIADGGVLCWGQFAPPGTTAFDAVLPKPVPGIAGAALIASGDSESCASVDGGVMCFGTSSAQLALPPVVSLCVGSGFACAVNAAGQILCWGDNTHGQLGTDAGASSSVPVVVQNVSGATTVRCGRAHACAIVSNRQVACWGEGAHGKLGDGATEDRPFATNVSD